MHTSENKFICFRVSLSIIACDLPAKNDLQNFVGATGKFGCGYCYQEGVSIKNVANKTTVRFIKKENMQLRTHAETIELMKHLSTTSVNRKKNNSLKGVRGSSAL